MPRKKKTEGSTARSKPAPRSVLGGNTSMHENRNFLDVWNEDPHLKEVMDLARQMRKKTYGLYASIPILCRGDECPYKQNCFLWKAGLEPLGDKCPIEIAAIEDLFQRYFMELGIDPEDTRNSVDIMMVKEIVDIDISMLRCESKMAINADFIIENVVGMTEGGNAIFKQDLHPAVEYKEKLRTSKNKLLQLLNSTRKDKEGSRVHIQLDPSQKAAEMIRLQRELKAIDEQSEKEKETYFKKRTPEIIEIEPIGFE